MSESFTKIQEATEQINVWKQKRMEASKEFLKEFLSEKLIELGNPCELRYVKDQQVITLKGVFTIVDYEDTAVLRFFPYRSNGVLSKNSKSLLGLGLVPYLSWESFTYVGPCEAPPVILEEEV